MSCGSWSAGRSCAQRGARLAAGVSCWAAMAASGSGSESLQDEERKVSFLRKLLESNDCASKRLSFPVRTVNEPLPVPHHMF